MTTTANPSMTNPGGPRRRRRSSALIASLAFALALFAPASPAGAISTHCDTTQEMVKEWAITDSEAGLSTRGWDRLRMLAPIVAECAGESVPLIDRDTERRPTGNPVFRGMGEDAEQWTGLATLYFEVGDVERVVCLIAAESGGNPNAQNPSTGAAGLMQVMPFWAGVFGFEHSDLFDPHVNLWISRQILALQGWEAWSPYLRGTCA